MQDPDKHSKFDKTATTVKSITQKNNGHKHKYNLIKQNW